MYQLHIVSERMRKAKVSFKGTVSRDLFSTSVFFHKTVPLAPLNDDIDRFRFVGKLSGDIQILKNHKMVAALWDRYTSE